MDRQTPETLAVIKAVEKWAEKEFTGKSKDEIKIASYDMESEIAVTIAEYSILEQIKRSIETYNVQKIYKLKEELDRLVTKQPNINYEIAKKILNQVLQDTNKKERLTIPMHIGIIKQSVLRPDLRLPDTVVISAGQAYIEIRATPEQIAQFSLCDKTNYDSLRICHLNNQLTICTPPMPFHQAAWVIIGENRKFKKKKEQ